MYVHERIAGAGRPCSMLLSLCVCMCICVYTTVARPCSMARVNVKPNHACSAMGWPHQSTHLVHIQGLACTGNQMMLSPDEEDLEQLIKGGPFELGLYADKLGSHMFGIDSVAQVCGAHFFTCSLALTLSFSFSPSCCSPLIWCHQIKTAFPNHPPGILSTGHASCASLLHCKVPGPSQLSFLAPLPPRPSADWHADLTLLHSHCVMLQTGTGFSPPPLPWQTISHLPQQQLMNSPVLQPLHQPHHQQQQHLGPEEPIHSSFHVHRVGHCDP